MPVGTAGSIIMNAASILFMGGLLIYTALYRQRGRTDDRLFFAMVLVNMALAFTDGVSYLAEGLAVPYAGTVLIVCNTLFFTMSVVIPWLFLLYIDFRAYGEKERLRKLKLWTAVPWLLFFAVLLINLKTGWIFTVGEDNIYRAGPFNSLFFVPAAFYAALALVRVSRIGMRLVFLGVLLIGARIGLGIWFREISSTAFIYTLFLVCAHIQVMNRSLNEEKA